MNSVFNKTYTEFCDDLLGACPEYAALIEKAKALSPELREKRYKDEVLKSKARSSTENPKAVLPGVILSVEVWSALSTNTHKAILDYLRLLDVASTFSFTDLSGAQIPKEFIDRILGDWREKMDKVDFQSLSSKFMSLFTSSGTDVSGGSALPPLPERFLKGRLAQLAEDMVREFRPEDFGLSVEELAACEEDPSRAFELLMRASTQNPERLQSVMLRVARKLQSKIQNGSLKPQELAREAEELIAEFQSHPAFVDMLQGFKDVFSFEDPENARRMGANDSDRRLAIARARLRKRQEAKKAAGGAGTGSKKK